MRLKGPKKTAEITLLNIVDRSRRVKKILRNTSRYSHDSLGHCGSQTGGATDTSIHFHTLEQTTNATATTQCSVNAEEQTLLFKWMSKDYHGEVTKFELSSFHRIAKQSKLAEPWKDAHWVGKLKRPDEHLFVIRSLTRSARACRRQARVEKWNLGSVRTVLNRLWDSKASTEIDTSVERTQTSHKMRQGYRNTLSSTI